MSHAHHFWFSERFVDANDKSDFEIAKAELRSSFGHLNAIFLRKVQGLDQYPLAAIVTPALAVPNEDVIITQEFMASFWGSIKARMYEDTALKMIDDDLLRVDDPVNTGFTLLQGMRVDGVELEAIRGCQDLFESSPDRAVNAISPENLGSIVIDLSESFSNDEEDLLPKTAVKKDLNKLEDVELVIVRPNIEHNMLGIIMGLGGESLGNTLWGQTELSVYDDSMHGIWGMSYKYHERAIVFNERNLIRLWDIAYDGYNGGKDDTYVDWMNPDATNGFKNFQELTMDVSKNYRGPSMMVMAFVHDRTKLDMDGQSYFEKHFKRNWPSPIVFHDNDNDHSTKTSSTLPLDYDNLQVVDVQEFRVFNNPLYSGAYSEYKNMMPAFHDMHIMRKSAGQASAEAETQTDSLAFQGSMRVKENGVVIQDIQGSGHHGPDYTGVASVRAGKGQKVAGQAPILHRLI
jgi:hypothetical protein